MTRATAPMGPDDHTLTPTGPDASPVPLDRRHDARLRKDERLRKRPEFRRAQRGTRYVTPALVVIACDAPDGWSRLGLVVSKKVGKSHVRSLVKRRLREIFRRNKAEFPLAFDFVWIARNGAVEVPYEDLARQAIEGSRKAAGRHRGGSKRKPSRS